MEGNGNSFKNNRPTTKLFWVYLLTADERSETATPTIILFTFKSGGNTKNSAQLL